MRGAVSGFAEGGVEPCHVRFTPRADVCSANAHVCFGPKADIQACNEAAPRASNEYSSAEQNNPDFGELAQLRIDFDCARMLLDDDVVADGEAKACALSGRLGGEERVEYLVFHVRRNASAIIADPDFYAIAKILG